MKYHLKQKWIYPFLLMLANVGLAQEQARAWVPLTDNLIEITDRSVTSDTYFERCKDELQLLPENTFVLEKQKTTHSGWRHAVYSQHYQNVPILGSRIVLHEQDGVLRFVTGHFEKVPAVNAVPAINGEKALSSAMAYVRERETSHLASSALELRFDTSRIGKPELWLYKSDGDGNTGFQLVYVVPLKLVFPVSEFSYYFVDAQTGRVIRHQSGSFGANGQVNTLSYGPQNIETQWGGSILLHRLRDFTRGNGIETSRCSGASCINNFYNDADNVWNDNHDKRVHGSAHFAIQRVWDYYLNVFNRNGPDGNGKAIVVHPQNYNPNNLSSFRNSSTPGVTPMEIELNQPVSNVCIDRVSINCLGHEFTHGVGAADAGWTAINMLNTTSETSAIMEGYCDAFSEFAEFDFQNSVDWRFDNESFLTTANIRVFFPPVLNGSQAMGFGDANWNTFTDGHERSGVLLHWVHMLSDGEAGVNHLNANFCVRPIGIKKVEAILFDLMDGNFLSSSTDFSTLRILTILTAQIMFGNNSNEVAQVTAAWHAVGVGSAFNGQINLQNHVASGVENHQHNCLVEILNFDVTAPSGNVTVTSNTEIKIGDGFNSNQGAVFSAFIAPDCNGFSARAISPGANPLADAITPDNPSEPSHTRIPVLAKDEQEGFVIQPNPSNGNFQVLLDRSDNLPETIRVYDAQGKMVVEKKELEGYVADISMPDLPTGVYLVLVNYPGRSVTKKVVKSE